MQEGTRTEAQCTFVHEHRKRSDTTAVIFQLAGQTTDLVTSGESRAVHAADASPQPSLGQKLVGQPTPRVDGKNKVQGRAQYIADLTRPGMWHGATKRSDIPHGTLNAIHLDPAFDWTDIVVVTADDIPGQNAVFLLEDDQPALVPIGGTIKHVDEALALVAAPTRERMLLALEHLYVDATALPAVFDPLNATKSPVKLYGDDNIFQAFAIDRGASSIESIFRTCAHVVEGTYRTGAQEHMYIEPQGMLAEWNDGTCRITGSMQCPFYIQKALVNLLCLEKEELIIEQAVTGGGFGGKEEYPSMIAAHAALLAKKAGVPVALIYEREEDIAATTKRHPAVVHHRMGFDETGHLLAIDVDVLLDGGAYLTLSPVVLSRSVLHAAGPYRCENTRIRGRVVATNTPPFGAFRGFGAPQVTFAYERQMQKAAKALGLDPFTLREQNMLRKGDETTTSQVLTDSVGSREVMEAIRKAGELPITNPSARHDDSPMRFGRGISFYFHGAGFTGSGEARLAGRATVALLNTGTFEVRSSSTDIGQGAKTIFAQIAATALSVDISAVSVCTPATDQVPDSGPTVASRTCMVVGKVVERACNALAKRMRKWAEDNNLAGAPLLEVAQAMAKRGETITETTQYEPPPGIVWDDETYTGSAYPCYGWAACLVDVSVDLDTYEVRVDRCVHAVDVGKAINPVIVKGQIEGGTLQSLGWALLEEVQYEGGRVQNRRMSNCIVPTFADAPPMETILFEKPFPYGPSGAKGVGEIPMNGPCAAVANAIEDALGECLSHDACDRLPILPEQLANAVRSAP